MGLYFWIYIWRCVEMTRKKVNTWNVGTREKWKKEVKRGACYAHGEMRRKHMK